MAMSVKPSIAFSGVRISCDMLKRNALFALFASSAFSRFAISRFVSASTLWKPAIT